MEQKDLQREQKIFKGYRKCSYNMLDKFFLQSVIFCGTLWYCVAFCGLPWPSVVFRGLVSSMVFMWPRMIFFSLV